MDRVLFDKIEKVTEEQNMNVFIVLDVCSYFFSANRYQESGIMWHWFANILSNKSNIMDYYLKPPTDGGLLDYDPLNLRDLTGVFYLWTIGITISFLVFLGELFVFRMQNRGHPKPKFNIIEVHKRKATSIFPKNELP